MSDPTASTVAQTGFSRVFLIEGRAQGNTRPEYQAWMRAGPLAQGFGDIRTIEVPSPNLPNTFVIIGGIRGAMERATTTITGRYSADLKSRLLELAKRGCPVDVHIHFGVCTPPSNFDRFTKVVVLEDAYLLNFSTNDVGALQTDQRAIIDEQSNVSATAMLEIVPLAFGAAGASLVVSELVDIVVWNYESCGGVCGAGSNGRDHIYAVSKSRAGSPGLKPDLIYSIDGGATWNSSTINSAALTDDPSGVALVGEYVVVINPTTNSLEVVLISELDTLGAETWVAATLGFVAVKVPNDIDVGRDYGWIAADDGYIYKTAAPADGVEVSSNGTVTSEDLVKISALNDSVIAACGDNNTILRTVNGGETWEAIVGPAVGVALTAICVLSNDLIWIGTAGGRLYYTTNGGATWTEKSFAGAGSGKVWDIAFSGRTVGYMAHSSTLPRGRMFRTYNGGYTWIALPESAGALPLTDHIGAVAVSTTDPNFVAGACLSDDGTDGEVLIGQPS